MGAELMTGPASFYYGIVLALRTAVSPRTANWRRRSSCNTTRYIVHLLSANVSIEGLETADSGPSGQARSRGLSRAASELASTDPVGQCAWRRQVTASVGDTSTERREERVADVSPAAARCGTVPVFAVRLADRCRPASLSFPTVLAFLAPLAVVSSLTALRVRRR